MKELYVVFGTSGTIIVRNAYAGIIHDIVNKLNFCLFKFERRIKNYMHSLYDVACVVGYTGDNCDNKCTFPSYGNDCQMPCACH